MAFPISESHPVVFHGPAPEAADVVIIGGGVIGVCTALHLARAGQKVVLCEKGRIAGEQSSRNWGWIRQQGRDPDELPIAMQANRIWQDLAAQTNTDIGLRQVGISYLARDEAEMQDYRDWYLQAKDSGIDTRMLSRTEVARMNPDMAQSYVGGMHTASDLRAEPAIAVPALAAIAAKEGAVLVENCTVRGLDVTNRQVAGVITEAGRIACTRVVVAGGAWSSLFLRAHRVNIPQLSVRASVAATKALPDIGAHACADDRVAWRRREDGGYTLAAGGFHELMIGPDAFRALPKYLAQLKADPLGTSFLTFAPKGFPDAWDTARKWDMSRPGPFEKKRVLNPAPNMHKLQQVAASFGALFPRLGPVQIAKAWAGMIDTMPDVVPVVDEVAKLTGLIIGTGFSGHGFGIGPGMGKVLADLAIGNRPDHDLTRFRLSRFADGSPMVIGPSV